MKKIFLVSYFAVLLVSNLAFAKLEDTLTSLDILLNSDMDAEQEKSIQSTLDALLTCQSVREKFALLKKSKSDQVVDLISTSMSRGTGKIDRISAPGCNDGSIGTILAFVQGCANLRKDKYTSSLNPQRDTWDQGAMNAVNSNHLLALINAHLAPKEVRLVVVEDRLVDNRLGDKYSEYWQRDSDYKLILKNI